MRYSFLEPLEARIAPAAVSVAAGPFQGSEEGGTISFKVTLDAALQEPLTVFYKTYAGGSSSYPDATPVTDFDATENGSFVIPAGDTEFMVPVNVYGNTAIDGDRDFSFELVASPLAPDSYTLGSQKIGNGIIQDNDLAIASVSSASVTEGDSGSSMMEFTVTLAGTANYPVKIYYSTVDGTATAGQDYTASTNAFITIPAGQLTGTISIPILGDLRKGADETFTLRASPTTPVAGEGVVSGVGTIIDNDADVVPHIEVTGPVSPVVEGAKAVFKVELIGAPESATAENIAIRYTVGGGTALSGAGADYILPYSVEAEYGTLTFTPTKSSWDVEVTTNVDNIVDVNAETFNLNAYHASNLYTADSATATIAAETPPTLVVTNTSTVEGNTGSDRYITYTVSTSQATNAPISFDYRTIAGGTATAGTLDPLTGDFVAIPDWQTLAFAVNSSGGTDANTSVTFTVRVNGDTVLEPNETVLVELGNVVGAKLPGGGTTYVSPGTITDDEINYQIVSATDPLSRTITAVEGGLITFKVIRSTADGAATVRLSTVNGLANQPVRGAIGGSTGDFVTRDFDVAFADGETEKLVTIQLNDDNRYEGAEYFNVKLTNPSVGAIVDDQGTGVVNITDNESVPTIKVSNVTKAEGNGTSELAFTVELSHPSEIPITVPFYTIDGTAISTGDKADFIGFAQNSNSTLTIPANTLSKVQNIVVNGDSRQENNETFTFQLGTPSLGTLLNGGTATATLTNDDFVTITVADASVAEGTAGGTNKVAFNVKLSGASDIPITVQYSTAVFGSSALAAKVGADFTSKTGTLTFEPGAATEQNVEVAVFGDTVQEGDESFLLNISNATGGATIARAQAIGTILNDDLGVRISNVTVVEGNTGVTKAVFTITLDSAVPVGHAVSLRYYTVDGTATSTGAAADFVPKTEANYGTVTFAAGQRVKTVEIEVKGDRVAEGAAGTLEDFFLVLSNAKYDTADRTLSGSAPTAQGPFAANTIHGTGTIREDDGDATTVSVTAAATQNEGNLPPPNSDNTPAPNPPEPVPFTINFSQALQYDTKISYTVTTQVGDGPATTVTEEVTVPLGSTSYVISDITYIKDSVAGPDTAYTVTLVSATPELGNGVPVTAALSTTQKVAKSIVLDDDATVSVSGAPQVAEGNSGETDMKFTVTLSAVQDHDTVITYSTIGKTDTNGLTATATGTGADFVSVTNGTIIIKKGDTTGTITVKVKGDTAYSLDETLEVSLVSATGATLSTTAGATKATGTILNDDAAPTLTLAPVSVGETGTTSGTTTTPARAVFTAKLSAATESDFKFNYSTVNGTAIAGTDVTSDFKAPALTGTNNDQPAFFVIPAGQTSVALTGIDIFDDTTNEAAETFQVLVAEAHGIVPVGGVTGTATIVANDLPYLVISAAPVLEGNTGDGFARVIVSLRNATNTANVTASAPVTFDISLAEIAGGATLGSDFNLPLQLTGYSIAAGESQLEILIPITGDTVLERDEAFTVSIVPSTSLAANITTGSTNVVIKNDESTFTIINPGDTNGGSNITVLEGQRYVTLEVRRTGDLSQAAKVRYEAGTLPGNTATANFDYRAATAELSFAAGESSKLINIPLVNDGTYEGSETFSVSLVSSTDAAVSATQGKSVVTITDDEATPAITVKNPVIVTEGNSGYQLATFTISLSRPNTAGVVTVSYTTADITAIAGLDYETASGSLTFGEGEISKTVTVKVFGETRYDSATLETFALNLSLVGGEATLDPAVKGTGTIRDNDKAPTIRIAPSGSVDEGDTAAVAVTLSNASDRVITATYYTVDGTAKSANADVLDFTGLGKLTPNTLTFTPGQTTLQAFVDTLQDDADPLAEGSENFKVQLGTVTNAVLDKRAAVSTVTVADDEAPVITIGSVTVEEGTGGAKEAVFLVSLSQRSALPVSVQFSTVAGTALAGLDFVAQTGSVVFPALAEGDDLTQEIRIALITDGAMESTTTGSSEIFEVQLSNAVNAELVADLSKGTGTIVDDDDVPTLYLTSDALTKLEGTGANSTFTFTPRLTKAATSDITFTVGFLGQRPGVGLATVGSAFDGNGLVDVIGTTKNFTIKAGELTPTVDGTVQTFVATVGGDSAFELAENFTVSISNVPEGVATGQTSITATINEDDVLITARKAQWIDTDGDLVTLTVSKGNLALLRANGGFQFLAGANGAEAVNANGGRSLDLLNFYSAGQSYLKANVTIDAVAQPGFNYTTPGDGFVRVGTIQANNVLQVSDSITTRGVDLGAVKVDGALRQIYAGDLYNDIGLRSLDVQSLGVAFTESDLNPVLERQNEAPRSIIIGGIGTMKIAGDLAGELNVLGNQYGVINSAVIGGSLKAAAFEGQALDRSGYVFTTGRVGSFTVGSILGGAGESSGNLFVDGNIGALLVRGDLKSGSGVGAGLIFASGTLTKLTIDGNIDNSAARNTVGEDADSYERGSITVASIGTAEIAGSILGGSIRASNAITSLHVGGEVKGVVVTKTVADGNDAGSENDTVSTYLKAAITAGGSVNNLAIKSLVIDGNVTGAKILAGYLGKDEAARNGDAQIGTVQFNGNISAVDVVAGAKLGGSSSNAGAFGDATNVTIPAGSTTRNEPGVLSRIAAIIINGDILADELTVPVVGTDGQTTQQPISTAHGIVAQSVDSITIKGMPVTSLTPFYDGGPKLLGGGEKGLRVLETL